MALQIRKMNRATVSGTFGACGPVYSVQQLRNSLQLTKCAEFLIDIKDTGGLSRSINQSSSAQESWMQLGLTCHQRRGQGYSEVAQKTERTYPEGDLFVLEDSIHAMTMASKPIEARPFLLMFSNLFQSTLVPR